MKIQFYPYDFEYKIENEKVFVYLYSKLEDGTKICVSQLYEPYFYAEKEVTVMEIDNARIIRVQKEEKQLLGELKPFWKIVTNYPKAVPILARALEEKGIKCYERDILFTHRYVRDKGITPLTLVEAEGEFVTAALGLRIPLFHATTIKNLGMQTASHWNILAVDIETYAEKKEIDFQRNPILMLAFYGIDSQGNVFEKVITWKSFLHNLPYVELVKDEAELLQRFREIVLSYQPDILTGYFSDGFDLPYIKARAEKHKIPLAVGLDFSELTIRGGTGLRDDEAKIAGILHVDILKFIRSIFGGNLKTDSYSLDAVSRELLGHQKHKVNLDTLSGLWDQGSNQLADFCAYNLHDAILTHKLCSLLLPDILEFTKILGLPPYDIIRMRFSKLVESYILKRAQEFNVLAPNKPAGKEMENRMSEHVQGAFVFEPIPNLYKDVVVFDFRSLYPTIISAHNISPESFRKGKGEIVPEHPQYWFSPERAFLPTVLDDLITRRSDLKQFIKEQKKKGQDTKILEARSYALKILANSFYGYLGFFGARWYCLECAASTTAYARYYIKTTIQKAEEKGFKVIYADTDSCFLLLDQQPRSAALTFMEEINATLPGQMELEFEGYFSRGIFVPMKGSEKGAKKKYALLRENQTLKIVGFETIRRNWSILAKEIQEKVLTLVLQDQPEQALATVQQIIKDLKEGKISKDRLILKTQITRPLKEYAAIGPHVRVAQKLAARGEPVGVGSMIEYIITKGTGNIGDRAMIPTDIIEGSYDADYYINNQIIPAVAGILGVLGYTEEQLLGKSKQMGLGNFF